MENIIKKAIKGGWMKKYRKENTEDFLEDEHGLFVCFSDIDTGETTATIYQSEIVCDPLFWKALAKACRWDRKYYDLAGEEQEVDEGEDINDWLSELDTPFWKHYAIRFYEINLTEGWEKALEWLEDLIK